MTTRIVATFRAGVMDSGLIVGALTTLWPPFSVMLASELDIRRNQQTGMIYVEPSGRHL